MPRPTLYNRPASYKTAQPYPYTTKAIIGDTAQYSPVPAKQDFFYRSNNPNTFETVYSANNYAQFKNSN